MTVTSAKGGIHMGGPGSHHEDPPKVTSSFWYRPSEPSLRGVSQKGLLRRDRMGRPEHLEVTRCIPTCKGFLPSHLISPARYTHHYS